MRAFVKFDKELNLQRACKVRERKHRNRYKQEQVTYNTAKAVEVPHPQA